MSLIQAALEKAAKVRDHNSTSGSSQTPTQNLAPKADAPQPTQMKQALLTTKPAIKLSQKTSKPASSKNRHFGEIVLGLILLAVVVIFVTKVGFKNVSLPDFSKNVLLPVEQSSEVGESSNDANLLNSQIERQSALVRSATSTPSFFSKDVFSLSGIVDLGDEPCAIINGKVLRAGNSVTKSAVVKWIGASEVLLDVRGKDVLLKM